MNYTEININTNDSALKDLLIAELTQIAFEGFEETDWGLKAFLPDENFNEEALKVITEKYEIEYEKTNIPSQNWNELWESNFNPMTVDDFVGVRASFHAPIQNVEHEIIITPKMSFGTGHHATTYMMMDLMRNMDFKNKTVYDFGSGTGILAILAEKLGSDSVLAVDYDDWCIENSLENVASNACKFITIEKSDNANTGETFDIVLANINKNIILDNIVYLSKDIKPNGYILLSGLLPEDEKDILNVAESQGWEHLKTVTKNNWIALKFLKSLKNLQEVVVA